MKKDMKKKEKLSTSTFEREMKKPKFKKAFDKSYKEFLLYEVNFDLRPSKEK